MNCPCLTAPLSEYCIVVYPNPEGAPADFIKKHGMWPLEAERYDNFTEFDRSHNMPITQVYTRVKSFTIADAFKFIEHKAGIAKPIHRVLELKDGEWRVAIECATIKPKEQLDREIAVLKAAGLWKEASE